jgi:hypothetical protein
MAGKLHKTYNKRRGYRSFVLINAGSRLNAGPRINAGGTSRLYCTNKRRGRLFEDLRYSSYHNFDDTFKWVYKSHKLTGSIHFDIRRPENVEFHRYND